MFTWTYAFELRCLIELVVIKLDVSLDLRLWNKKLTWTCDYKMLSLLEIVIIKADAFTRSCDYE